MLNLPLLIQLFGREVIDSLERSGFDDEARISVAGPVRLATESGISLPVAQRIVAVVEEMRVAPRSERSRPATRRNARPAAKGVARRPRHRSRGIRIEVKPVPEFAPPDRAPTDAEPAAPDQGDSFVDDVALVSWMGFSSKTSSGGRLPFSVADGILDHLRRDPPAGEVRDAVPPEETSVEPAARTAEAEAPLQANRPPDPGAARTLPGSFWSFGGPAEPAPKRISEDDHSTDLATERVPDSASEPPADRATNGPQDVPADRALDPQPQTDPPRRRIRHDH